jgi:hypothetical protein
MVPSGERALSSAHMGRKVTGALLSNICCDFQKRSSLFLTGLTRMTVGVTRCQCAPSMQGTHHTNTCYTAR